MAASSDDEDSVWPGYVDALTTMVMVMTLVMMILGVVVFGMSQGISRKFLERVAEAANVDAGTDVATKKLSDDLVAWVQRHADLGSAPYLSPGEYKPRGGPTQGTSQLPDPGVTSRQLSTPGPLPADVASVSEGPYVGPPMKDVTATSSIQQAQPFSERPPGSKLVDAPGRGWPAAPPMSDGPREGADAPADVAGPTSHEAIGPAGAPPAQAPRQVAALEPSSLARGRAVDLGPAALEPVEIVSRQRPDLESARAGSRVSRSPGARTAITVRFDEKATRLDAEAFEKVKQTVQGGADLSGSPKIIITGLAGISGSSVSDARRTAYYRVIAVREALIAAGIKPGALRMGVVDTSNTASDIVTVAAEI